MAKVMIGGRPSKAALGRMKIVTVGVSIAAFLGTLGVIAGSEATAVPVVANQASQVAFSGSGAVTSTSESSTAATVQQPGFSAPITRSRGS